MSIWSPSRSGRRERRPYKDVEPLTHGSQLSLMRDKIKGVHRFSFLVAMTFLIATAGAQTAYRQPPKPILDVLNAPETPSIYVSPTGGHALLAERLRYPPIAEVARPMLRLAGVRIDPRSNGQHDETRYVGLELVELISGQKTKVGLPEDGRVVRPQWSPDGRRFAVLVEFDERIELWVGKADGGEISRVTDRQVNVALGIPMEWMPDNRTIALKAVPAGRGEPPQEPQTPTGPVVQQAEGKAGPVRTYQDLLENEHDEALFDYYATAEIVLVDVESGEAKPIGEPAVHYGASPAPDGRHLLVETFLRPYSYQLPYYRFPYVVEVWDTDGELVKEIARLPLADNVPIQGVPTGPRSHRWHPVEPATVIWAEALDEGDPKKDVPFRDQLYAQAGPFEADPAPLAKLEERFIGLSWLDGGGEQALVSDYDVDRRWVRTLLIDRDPGEGAPREIWSRSAQDSYNDPGDPVMRELPSGHRVILREDNEILLNGRGASPEGDRPFLDEFNLQDKSSERLFHSAPNVYEYVVAVLDNQGRRFLTRRESPTDPPNYYVRAFDADTNRALTHFTDPAPELREIQKRRVTYQRDDGVDLSFTLYLPPGYKEGEDEPLPTVMWAYPREYNTAQTAGQIRGSTQRFTLLSGSSHLFFLLAGYAILDGATLPVVGDPETANDTYIEQIVAGAKAAIDKAAELGVTDPKRVGIAGHSYGAFMAANLLAHSDLFEAGIARSGAYNRTLTPFGFQAERRTFWEAPQIYFRVSPFMSANTVNEPLLLIHGMADNNSGTFPVQSERMYHAIRGNGGVARLVMLPHESHGYRARESIEHVLAEMIDWFDEYVKGE